MNAVGVVRKTDTLGRITIPKEVRMALEIDCGSCLEIFVSDNNVVLKKYNPSCILCGNDIEIKYYKGKPVCKECIEDIR